MKKITLAAAAIIAATVFTACGNSTPKAELKTDVDSLSYAIGLEQGQGVKQYLVAMQLDTAYLDDFVKGLNDAAKGADDKKKAAYNAGVGVGQQVNQMIKQQINRQIFGEDTTQSISVDNFIAGFAASAKGKDQKFTIEDARKIEQTVAAAVQAKSAEKTYGAYKKQNEAYLVKNAKKPGIKTIGQGVQVLEIKKGTGAVPKNSDMVKINYEGKTIDGKTFDKRDGATMPVGGVIPGFTEALTKMPVGSKWEVTIPAAAGYGAKQAGPQIKPFSTLVFTIELVSIEKSPESAASVKK